MVIFEVVRDGMPNDAPVTGELLVEGQHFCYTIELPWRENARDVSCIPLGAYPVVMAMSHHFGRPMPLYVGVPGRTAAELHAANTIADLLGCTGLGDTRGSTPGTLAYPSRPASDRFNAWMMSNGGSATAIVRLA
jgi:hypothetical protein